MNAAGQDPRDRLLAVFDELARVIDAPDFRGCRATWRPTWRCPTPPIRATPSHAHYTRPGAATPGARAGRARASAPRARGGPAPAARRRPARGRSHPAGNRPRGPPPAKLAEHVIDTRAPGVSR
ncbi:hypothetical protein [Nonomuraea dietziae]|uniref:hypothetical protein n=1 Tax=Nonomuraea dietziae TaxID=65515 RepID=UPI0031DB69FE